MTRTWTLPHGLHDPKPAVSLFDIASRDVSGSVRWTWPSAYEVAIMFAEPPPVGMRYQVEVVASANAHRTRIPAVSRR